MPAKGTFEWIFFVPMLVLLGLFLFFSLRSLRIVLTFQKTTGTADIPEAFNNPEALAHLESISMIFGERVYFVVNNQVYTAASRTRTSSNLSLKKGQNVPVYYSLTNPDDARIGIFRELWLVPLIFFVLWSIFFIIWFGALMGPVAVGDLRN